MRSERGFTMLELVAVMVITAILAVFASSMFTRSTFDSPAFASEVRAQLAYAQKLAIATRRTVTVTVAGNALSMQVCDTEACANQVNVPTLRGAASLTPPSGSSLAFSSAPPVFTFDARGRSAGAALSITGTGNITVSADTGYVF